MHDSQIDCFADNYATARAQFLQACNDSGCQVESFPHPQLGPHGEELALDAAMGARGSARQLIISSGLHGLEGRVGSASQVDSLRRGLVDAAGAAGWSVLLLHGLNPFGFAYDRRWTEENVDANRNFLLSDQRPEGAHAIYHQLASLLNPPHAPVWYDSISFYKQAVAAILRHGFGQVKQAVAEGQYECPQGLFFGGVEPCWTHQVLDENLPGWLVGAKRVVHFDVHSGLGRWGHCTLLQDYSLRPWQLDWLESHCRPDQWEAATPEGTAYHARGGLGKWCDERFSEHQYLYLCAEFGSYSPLRVLRALRAENQAWRHCDVRPKRIVEEVREMFCPRRNDWRRAVVDTFWNLIQRALGPAKM